MKKNWLITALTLITITIIAKISTYFLLTNNEPVFPASCHYQLKYERKINGDIFENTESVTLLTTTPDKIEISIEGLSNTKNNSYHINRVIYYNVTPPKGDNLYVLKSYNTVQKHDDTIPDDFFSLQHSGFTSSIIIQIEKVKNNAYLLTTQISPLPICITKAH